METTDAKQVEPEDGVDIKVIQGGLKNLDFPSFGYMPVALESKEYNMNHPKRGKAVIFNQENFNSILRLHNREGTSKDRESLCSSLRKLQFDVHCYDDLSYAEIFEVIVKLASENHEDNDCLLIAVMSHGDHGSLYSRDKCYKAEELWSPFTSDKCPSLAGKPKMFIIQACQGNKTDQGTLLIPRVQSVDACEDVYKIPTQADFLFAYATAPGFFSWRNKAKGSWFIQVLSRVLSECGEKEDFVSLLTVVSRIIATEYQSTVPGDPNMDHCKQIPCLTSFLIRKIYFKPKPE